MPKSTRVCAVCGRTIASPRSSAQRYCSAPCREASKLGRRRHQRKNPPVSGPMCAQPGCPRPRYTAVGQWAGWCNSHYQQVRAGKEPGLIRRRASPGAPTERDSHGRKLCIDCDTWQETTQFCVSVKASDGLHGYCKLCTKRKKYRDRYGITPEQVAERAAAQGHRCKLCGAHEADLVGGLFVDHDHAHCGAETGCPDCVRGLLCRSCNSAIGLLRDDPDLMLAAAEYVRTKGACDAMETKRTG